MNAAIENSRRIEATRLSLNLPKDLVEEAEKLHDEAEAKGTPRRKSSLSIYGLEGLPPGNEVSNEHYIYHWLCWFMFHITVEQLLTKYMSGDFKAVKQFHKLNLTFDKWRFGLLDPNKLKFKTDLEHFDLMILGIDLGLETLSDEELASCFDELCPCGKEHFGENLRKLKDRVDKEFPLKDKSS